MFKTQTYWINSSWKKAAHLKEKRSFCLRENMNSSVAAWQSGRNVHLQGRAPRKVPPPKRLQKDRSQRLLLVFGTAGRQPPQGRLLAAQKARWAAWRCCRMCYWITSRRLEYRADVHWRTSPAPVSNMNKNTSCETIMFKVQGFKVF